MYSIRAMAEKEGFAAAFQSVADIGYVGVELAGVYGQKPADLRKLLDGLGLKVSGAHGPFPGPAQVAEVVDAAKTLGYEHYIVPWIGKERFQTADDIRRTAAVLEATAQLLKPHGITLAYHNHEHEMKLIDGRPALGLFYDAMPSVAAEIDTYWAANFGQCDAVAFVRQYARRAPLLHIKDGLFAPGSRMHTAVGAGKMDVPAIIAAADPSVLKWLVVELDNCETDMLTAVRESYAYLTSKGLATGRQ